MKKSIFTFAVFLFAVLLGFFAAEIQAEKRLYDIDFISRFEFRGRIRAKEIEKAFFPIKNARVAIFEGTTKFELPVDYTDWRGEFSVNDEVHFGYAVEMDEDLAKSDDLSRLHTEGTIVSGTNEVHYFLKVEREGYETAFFDLEPYYVKEEQIYCSTAPIEIRMTLLKREETEE